MFSIGGVAALKQHPFFEFTDWHALERLQVTPPFDFSALATNTADGSPAVGNGTPGRSQSGARWSGICVRRWFKAVPSATFVR